MSDAKNARDRERFQQCRRAGRCAKCGTPAEGWTYCAACRARKAARHQAARQARLGTGTCLHCAKAFVPWRQGQTYCSLDCLRAAAATSQDPTVIRRRLDHARRYQRRKAAGQCSICAAEHSWPHCDACRARVVAARVKYRARRSYRLQLATFKRVGERFNASPSRWVPTTPPKATHIAGYVPPPGSIAQHFFGRVVAYH